MARPAAPPRQDPVQSVLWGVASGSGDLVE